jgi:rhodanese-related sulfurtransferase
MIGLGSLIRILVIIAVAAGAAVGYIGARGLPWVPDAHGIEQEQDLHARLRVTVAVGLEEFRELISHGAVVIDARSRAEYENGHLAINCDLPVLSVPAEEIDAHVDRLMQLQALPVVVYCGGPACDYAEELYLAVQDYGFMDIRIFFPGWEGILEAGLKTATGPDTWTGFDELGQPVCEDELCEDEAAPEVNTPDEVEP